MCDDSDTDDESVAPEQTCGTNEKVIKEKIEKYKKMVPCIY